MEKAPEPGSPADRPSLPSESASPGAHLNRAAQTLTPVPSSADAPTQVPESSGAEAPTRAPQSSRPGGQTAGGAAAAAQAWAAVGLQPGATLGGRYEILEALGQGGMGAVYKARDRELDRVLALKVIRPDLARNPAVVRRFKQELILARQVTHRNVVRIFDLGEADGIKFITMEFIEGKDLRSLLLQRKKFSPEEAAEIIRQVCLALDSAHSEGVIHRDLKPQNIMRDAQGRIVVMDFGLAHSLESGGMTQTGALVGTLEYMSPEQGLGQELDQRSDLFALGLISYELLTGRVPYKAESALASLLKRTQQRAIPVCDLDNQVPRALSNIVARCLERDPKQRYGSARELLADLDAWQGKSAAASLRLPAVQSRRDVPWIPLSAAALVIILAVTGFWQRANLFRPRASRQAQVKPEISLAILPFRNASGDPHLDWLGPSIGDMLTTDIGQSARVRTVSPDRLHQVISDLKIPPDMVSESKSISRIAEFSNADTVVWGQFAKVGDQIRIDAALKDLKHDRSVRLKTEGSTQSDLPSATDRIADSIRRNLAVSQDVVAELKASSFQATSRSLQALQHYDEGLQFYRGGEYLRAQSSFQSATREDPKFALAFARLAQADSNLGYDNEAEQSAEQALGVSENLPPAEKYLISAIQAQVGKNYPNAIAAYENLARVSPENGDVQFTLASLYEDADQLAKAAGTYQRIVARNPRDIVATMGIARVAIKSGHLQAGLEPLNRALSLSIQVGNEEQKATALHAIGVAYRMLNKPEEALRNYEEALAIRRRLQQKRGIGITLNEMARVEALLGNPAAARRNFEEALQIRREIGDKRGIGDTLLDLGNFYDDSGNHRQALQLFKESLQIERDLGNLDLQAICLNNVGSVYFSLGQYQDALTYFQQVLELRQNSNIPQDIVDSTHNVAESSAKMGQYEQAIAYYMRALELRRKLSDSRGAAIESYSLGTLYDYEGRYGAALAAKQDALKTFRDLKDKSFWMAEILGGYAESLVLAGRGGEAQPYLSEALSVSRELKNNAMLAQTLEFQGDASYYAGQLGAARQFYEQALRVAGKASEPDKSLIAKIDLAKLALLEQPQAAVRMLAPLVRQAEDLGLKYISLSASLDLAEGMLRRHQYAATQQQLQRTLLSCDRLDLKPLSARAQYLLGTTLRETGNSTLARAHYSQALAIFDEIRQQRGAEQVLQRADFKLMYDQASRWSLNSGK